MGLSKAQHAKLFYASLTRAGISQAEDLARGAVATEQYRRTGRGTDPMLPLHTHWYESIDAGRPDWGVYDDPRYLMECHSCWIQMARRCFTELLRPGKQGAAADLLAPASGGTVYDLGCGIGMGTAVFAELYPSAKVVGTNLPDTQQMRVAKAVRDLTRTDFELAAEPTEHAEIVFASEYFEHFTAPAEHLSDVLAVTTPRVIIHASTFTKPAVGHFNSYLHLGQELRGPQTARAMSLTLTERGYQRLSLGFWNNRPQVWVRN